MSNVKKKTGCRTDQSFNMHRKKDFVLNGSYKYKFYQGSCILHVLPRIKYKKREQTNPTNFRGSPGRKANKQNLKVKILFMMM